jgi:pseudaminic acid cytidylyltransferase
MSVVALIPARGGSKRIPRKCIRVFAGEPMIAHPIRIAKQSGVFDRIIVSTDDDEIADIAKALGAEVPFIRPKTLADDHTSISEVIKHAITLLQNDSSTLKFICRLSATAALINPQDIVKGYEHMKKGSRFAMGIKAYTHPLSRALSMDSYGYVKMLHPEHFTSRTQDLVESYYDAGQFCWGTPENFLSVTPPLLSESTTGIRLTAISGLDIDTEEDWELAEIIFKSTKKPTNLK